jgi:osmotically-inducible protein OsmY
MIENRCSDADIEAKVERELGWEPSLGGVHIEVEVREKVAILRGEVESWAGKLAAQEAAHRAGAHDVANELRVTLPPNAGRSDAAIASAVRHALEWDTLVPEDRIESTVSEGVVTLEGRLEHWSEREAAEQAVQNLAGVVQLVNRIEVPTSVSPRDVRRVLVRALARHAAREAHHVMVSTREGEVTLAGEMESPQEKSAVLGAVRSLPGVREIRDLLSVTAARPVPGRPVGGEPPPARR